MILSLLQDLVTATICSAFSVVEVSYLASYLFIARAAHLCEAIKPNDIKGLPDAVMASQVFGEITWSALKSIYSPLLCVDSQDFVRAQWRVKDDSILFKRWIEEEILQRSRLRKLKCFPLSLALTLFGDRLPVVKIWVAVLPLPVV